MKYFYSKKILSISSTLILVLVFSFSLVPNLIYGAAGVPMLINFQGRLMDNTGELLGTAGGTDYCYKFSIYDATTGGSKIWPSGAPSTDTITTRLGVFDATIGEADTLDLTFTDDQAFVNVEVATMVGPDCTPTGGAESFETLSPRPQIVSSGFAINSKTVGGFTPAQSATNSQIPVLTSGAIILGHATTAGLTSTGANPLAVDAGASGVLNLNNTSTGNILLGGGSGSTGCTLTNATGAFACTAAITGSNLSGTNTGDITLSAIGASPNANGATLTGQVLNLEPASASFGGVVTTGTQTFAGAKTFTSDLTVTKNDASILFTDADADTDFWAGVVEDGGNDDDDFFQIGDGSTTGTNPFLTINTSGNVGIGDTSPNSLFTVGSGDLFQINSTGQIGSQTAPVSDYLFALAGTTGNDHSRIIDITQANNALENSRVISIANTVSTSVQDVDRDVYNFYSTLTPTASVLSLFGLPYLNLYGSSNSIDLSSVTLSDTNTDEVHLLSFGNHTVTTFNPIINDAAGNAPVVIEAYGTYSQITGTGPVYTSVISADILTSGGDFLNGVGSSGDLGVSNSAYGIRAIANSNLTTTGTTTHYGGYFSAGGTADTNYGIYSTVSGATTNYAAILMGGNVGIGTATPGAEFEVNSGTNNYVQLDVATNANAFVDISRFSNANYYGINLMDAGTSTYIIGYEGSYGGDAADLNFYGSSGAPKMVIENGGNVGIGDTSPAALFTVGSGDLFQVASNGNLTSSNAGTWTFSNDTNIALSGGVNGLSFDTDVLSIDATNNRVGVGLIAPLATFHVYDTIQVGSNGASNGFIRSPNNFGFTLDTDNDQSGTFFSWENHATTIGTGTELMRLQEDGKLGVGDASPNSLFTVGSGDLFQINSTGQIGSQQAPVSDYLFSLAGTTGNDHSRIIDITQANDSGETSTVINIVNTANMGTLTGGLVLLKNQYNSLTPTATVASATGPQRSLSIHGNDNAIVLSNTTLGDTSSNSATIDSYGYSTSITGTPVINNADASGDTAFHRIYGSSNTINITPTLTAAQDVQGRYYGQHNSVTVNSAGNSGYFPIAYGSYSNVAGDLTTTGSTAKYGGYFSVIGSADTNYGIYSTVSGATTNYAAILTGGNVGIGTTAPDRPLEVNSATGLGLRLTYNDADGSATNFADIQVGSAGQLNILPSGFITNIGGGATRTAMRFLEPSGTGTDYAAIQSNANVTTSYTWTLPAADASGCIQSNGSGTLSISACGGGSSALDGLTASTTDDAAILSGDNTIEWNWALTSAASKGFTIAESAASTGGSGNQHLLKLQTSATSTAGALEIISNSADGGDIEFNLASAGDFEIQDNGTAFATFSDSGQIGFGVATSADYLLTMEATTAADNSRVISITQSNDAAEDNYGIYMGNTSQFGSLGGSGSAFGHFYQMQPVATMATASGTRTFTNASSYNNVDMTNIVFGNSAGTSTTVEGIGSNNNISGNITVSDTNTTGTNILNIYGTRDLVSAVPSWSSSTDTFDFFSYGNYIENTSAPTADALLDSTIHGLYSAVSGNLTTTGTTAHYSGYFTASGTADINYGIYTTASGATTNLGLNVDAGQVLIGGTTLTTSTEAKINIVSSMASNGSTTAIAGIHGEYTINPSSGGTQVGNRFVMNNAPTSSANTSINTIIRTIDNTALANTVRGIEIVSSAGSNTAGTNTGLRATGATFGVQAITTGTAGGVALPAGLYAENTGTTQGDVARFYTGSMTSGTDLAMLTVFHDTSTFTGDGLFMDMASGSGTFTGNFLEFQNGGTQKFLVTSAGITSVNFNGTATTNGVCHSGADIDAATDTLRELVACNNASGDIAEWYETIDGVEAGDVVATTDEGFTYEETQTNPFTGEILPDKITRTIAKLDKATPESLSKIVGIVSTSPNKVIGDDIKHQGEYPKPVALSGRVPVKVSESSEPIEAGDYLTLSVDEAGKATKATKAGMVIGKALDSWSSGQATVMVYVEQGYFDGQSLSEFAGLDMIGEGEDEATLILNKFLEEQAQNGEEGSLVISEILTDRIAAGLEVITPKLVASIVNTSTLNVSNDATFSGLVVFGNASEDLLGKVTFDSQVEFSLPPIFNKDTAGFAVVKAGDRKVRVEFAEPYVMTPVVTASMTFEATDNIDETNAEELFAENISSLVIEKDETGFTILINKPAPQNIRFSWIALGVKDAEIFESLGDGLEITGSSDEGDEGEISPDTSGENSTSGGGGESNNEGGDNPETVQPNEDSGDGDNTDVSEEATEDPEPEAGDSNSGEAGGSTDI